MIEPDDDGKSAIPEFTKKLLSLGLGAYFLTEEKLMGYVREAKLPKEIGSSISSNATKAKDELLSFVSREVARAFKQFDVQEEIERALRRHRIKITAEIEFVPLADGPRDASSGEAKKGEAGGGEKPGRYRIETTITPRGEAEEGAPPSAPSEAV